MGLTSLPLILRLALDFRLPQWSLLASQSHLLNQSSLSPQVHVTDFHLYLYLTGLASPGSSFPRSPLTVLLPVPGSFPFDDSHFWFFAYLSACAFWAAFSGSFPHLCPWKFQFTHAYVLCPSFLLFPLAGQSHPQPWHQMSPLVLFPNSLSCALLSPLILVSGETILVSWVMVGTVPDTKPISQSHLFYIQAELVRTSINVSFPFCKMGRNNRW